MSDQPLGRKKRGGGEAGGKPDEGAKRKGRFISIAQARNRGKGESPKKREPPRKKRAEDLLENTVSKGQTQHREMQGRWGRKKSAAWGDREGRGAIGGRCVGVSETKNKRTLNPFRKP